MAEAAKRLALAVRTSTASEQFDIGGFGAENVDALVVNGLAQPLPLKKMIRLSFVVGGGKKVRQKYADGLPALLSDALRRAGYTEDRGAGLSLDCAGMYKYQHDTDKDLKFVHVYPRLDPAAAEPEAESSGASMSHGELLLYAERPTFERMIAAKAPSLAQRRRALAELKECAGKLEAIEKKLAAMEALDEAEQAMYDTADQEALAGKIGWLQAQMDAMVTKGQLTASEQKSVLEQAISAPPRRHPGCATLGAISLHARPAAQATAKLEALELQLASAESEGKAKRAEKLSAARAELTSRIDLVRGSKPISRPARHSEEMQALRKRIAELDKLEKSSKILPLADVEKIAARPRLREELAALEADAAGWFTS